MLPGDRFSSRKKVMHSIKLIKRAGIEKIQSKFVPMQIQLKFILNQCNSTQSTVKQLYLVLRIDFFFFFLRMVKKIQGFILTILKMLVPHVVTMLPVRACSRCWSQTQINEGCSRSASSIKLATFMMKSHNTNIIGMCTSYTNTVN